MKKGNRPASLADKIRRFQNRHRFTVPDIPLDRLERDCRTYEKDSAWDSAYRIATTLVAEGWSDRNQQKVADGLNVLLRIWNQQFYGPYSFDEPALRQWLACKWPEIDGYRGRGISSLSEQDHEAIARTFRELLPVLGKVSEGKRKESPVSVAKALHLLAPDFFPMWDTGIANDWKSRFSSLPDVAYIVFCMRMRECAQRLNRQLAAGQSPRRDFLKTTLLKRIDEYNYVNRKK